MTRGSVIKFNPVSNCVRNLISATSLHACNVDKATICIELLAISGYPEKSRERESNLKARYATKNANTFDIFGIDY